MDFRAKLEHVLGPAVAKLKEQLSFLPTLDVLDHYQFRIDTAKPDKSNVPDGFLTKWRYVWALKLSTPFVGEGPDGPGRRDFKLVDEKVEEVFDTYGIGAVQEPGRTPRSEEEFLTRLGLALKVREPDVLGFPEQIRRWARARFEPFDLPYFLPNFGLHCSEAFDWLGQLMQTCQSRLDACAQELVSITRDAQSIQAEWARGGLTLEAARGRAAELNIRARLETNAQGLSRLHLFSRAELATAGSPGRVDLLIDRLSIRPGDVPPTYTFPHHDNPLDCKIFAVLPNDALFFLDPANAYPVIARFFERGILGDGRIRERYLKNRDRQTEKLVSECLGRVFCGAELYTNYFLSESKREKDLLVKSGRTVVLAECKNSRVRQFKGAADDLRKFRSDFRASVQLGFEQALEAKRRILGGKEATLLDKKGRSIFSIRRDEVEDIYIICVTITPRGPFGTDLSYELEKPAEEPFPLAVNLFDLETISKHFTAEQFIAYLRARERLHGRVRAGDELNYAGYFLKHGNLDFQDGVFVADDFSGIFDRMWYAEKGVDLPEPSSVPVLTTISRKGGRVTIEHSSGGRQTLRVPPWMIEATGKPPIRMKGKDRNKPCPCGSGLKLKNCCGTS